MIAGAHTCPNGPSQRIRRRRVGFVVRWLLIVSALQKSVGSHLCSNTTFDGNKPAQKCAHTQTHMAHKPSDHKMVRAKQRCRVEALDKWWWCTPCEFPTLMKVGRKSAGTVVLRYGGPSQVEGIAYRSGGDREWAEPDAHTHRKLDKTHRITGYSHGDRPLWRSQMFITPVTSVKSNVRG